MAVPIAILAGGRSTRMATDKALLPVGGVPMLQRVVRAALGVSPVVLVVGREKPADWPAELAVTFLADEAGEGCAIGSASQGPLVGLITALAHTEARTLVLPCDAPLLSQALLRKLLAAHGPGALATMAWTPAGPEPLLAVYTPGLLEVLAE